jgi:hypothetical protein
MNLSKQWNNGGTLPANDLALQTKRGEKPYTVRLCRSNTCTVLSKVRYSRDWNATASPDVGTSLSFQMSVYTYRDSLWKTSSTPK